MIYPIGFLPVVYCRQTVMTLLGPLGLSGRNPRLKSQVGPFKQQFHTHTEWSLKRNRHRVLKWEFLVGSSSNKHSILWVPFGMSVRFLSSETKKRSYYDVLEISPKATKAQVKNAYYSLSKQYHPDQYKGKKDAALIFREITEAYEILGNFQKRRMYDKGIYNLDVAATPKEADEYSSKFYESRRKRGKVPTASGKTPIYNFDDWSKLHYEASFERKQNTKARFEEMQKTRKEIIGEQKAHSVVAVILLLAFAMFYNTLKIDKDITPPTKSSSSDQ